MTEQPVMVVGRTSTATGIVRCRGRHTAWYHCTWQTNTTHSALKLAQDAINKWVMCHIHANTRW